MPGDRSPDDEPLRFTRTQGEYLTFIHHYTKLNGVSPAHMDIQRYFSVTPPTVNSMIKRLHGLGLIERTPGKARSLRVLVARSDLPEL